jgi:hypothetical protein
MDMMDEKTPKAQQQRHNDISNFHRVVYVKKKAFQRESYQDQLKAQKASSSQAQSLKNLKTALCSEFGEPSIHALEDVLLSN